MVKILADPTRLRVAWLLLEGPLAVGDLAARLGRPPAAVSQHLAKMRMARLVSTRRDGTSVQYRIDDEHVLHLVREVLYAAEHIVTPSPAHHGPDSAGTP